MLTVTYLSRALGRPGNLESVQTAPIGTGQLGVNLLVELAWSDGVSGPSSVVAKLPSEDQDSRRFGIETGHYAREIEFYGSLAPTLAIRTPHIHHLDPESLVILMEDLSSARPGDQIAGCPPAQAMLAVESLGGLHGPRWNDPALLQLDGFQRSGPDWADARQESFRSAWPEFVGRYDGHLSAVVLTMGDWLAEHLSALLQIERSAFCLVHNDYRPDNLLFGEPGGSAPPLAVVDWQTCAVGSGPADAAYFIGGSLEVDQRREIESDLWRRYLDGLRRHLPPVAADSEAVGFEVVDPEALWTDYRLGSMRGLVVAALAAKVAERTARGDELFVLMAERHARHMIDLGLPDLAAPSLD